MSNLHKDLLNSELHNPKDFSTASNNTILRKNNSGNLEWSAENGGGIVTSLTTTGTSGASTLVGGVLNVPKILAGTNVTISPATGLGDVTINASGGGGEVTHHTSTTWQGCINVVEEGRLSSAYTFGEICTDRETMFMATNIGAYGAAITPAINVSSGAIISAGKVNITTNSTINYSWTGKIRAAGPSAGGKLALYVGSLVCEGEQPETYQLRQLAEIPIPGLPATAFQCFSHKLAFLNALNDGDIIVPVFSGNVGSNSLHYTNTLELQHS